MLLGDKIVVVPPEGHDTLDKVWGWSQLGGALVGLIALVIAIVSWRYAKKAGVAAEESARAAGRTADAAEKTAAIASEELEMLKAEASRRAVIEIKSIDMHPIAGAPRSAILQLGLLNSGNATTEGGWINLLVPPGTVISPCANEKGEGNLGPQPLQTSPEALRGTTSSEYLTAPVLLIEGMPTVAHYRLDFPSAGSYSIRVKLGATRAVGAGSDAFFAVP